MKFATLTMTLTITERSDEKKEFICEKGKSVHTQNAEASI